MEILLPYIRNQIEYTDKNIENDLIFIDENRKLLLAMNKLNCFDFEYFNKMHRLDHNLKKYNLLNMDKLSCKVLELFSNYLHENPEHRIFIQSRYTDSFASILKYYEECKKIHFICDHSTSKDPILESYTLIFYYSREESLIHSDETAHMISLIHEITNILKYLTQNGMLILKILTFFERRTLYFIYHLCTYFTSVKFYKPEISSHLDNGGFLICDGYLGNFVYEDKVDNTELFSKFIISIEPVVIEINKCVLDEINYIIETSDYFVGYTKSQSDKYCTKWIKKYFNVEENSCIKKLLC